MKVLSWWEGPLRESAPIGAYSFAVLALVAVSVMLFSLLLPHSLHVLVVLVVIAYLFFCPAVACSLYSLLFEPSKRFALFGLLSAGLALAAFPILLDSVIALPFTFLVVMGAAKFVKWRDEKNKARDLAHQR